MRGPGGGPPPHLELINTSSGTDALPAAWIEPPRISTWRLAEVAAMTLDRHPQMAVDLLADELIRQTLVNSPMESQRRAVHLAMEFGGGTVTIIHRASGRVHLCQIRPVGTSTAAGHSHLCMR